jgi:type VI secretion system protein ImpA
MALREDLLQPIPGDNPSGANLYYDKVFDQIKEARTEDNDTAPAGAWERTQKKADHVLVIKLAGETLATRSKDLRLAGWLVESHLKREGITLLKPCLELMLRLQETFWTTFYPEIEEDGNLDLRISSIESIVNRIALLLKNASITRSGLSALQYHESRRVGFEKDADTSEKQEARQDSINQGQITGEDFDTSFNATPKALFVANDAALAEAQALIGEIDQFHEEKYGSDYPNLGRMVTAIEEVRQVVSSLLYEKRKTDPDEDVEEVSEEEVAEEAEETPAYEEATPTPIARQAAPPKGTKGFSGVPTSAEQAYAAVLGGAVFLQGEEAQSPVPYLACAALRLGETRKMGSSPDSDFAVAPPTETRQALRRLANEGNWDELMLVSLKTLAEPCARAWLDLHRYIWRGARETGSDAIAAAVVSTIRGLLVDIPEVRQWMLDDDTPVANAETQQWIDAEVLPPLPVDEQPPVEEEVREEPVSFMPAAASSSDEEPKVVAIYEQATDLLKRGKTGEAITLLVRDAELQPSGRKRFQRRVQVAQLCLAADQDPIAYPVLMELSHEIERRGLETWETGEMLAHPLSLLLRCLEKRKSSAEDKEAVFERLCRLDPQAALGVRR